VAIFTGEAAWRPQHQQGWDNDANKKTSNTKLTNIITKQ
jgi:hypothetical protein